MKKRKTTTQKTTKKATDKKNPATKAKKSGTKSKQKPELKLLTQLADTEKELQTYRRMLYDSRLRNDKKLVQLLEESVATVLKRKKSILKKLGY